MAPWGGFFAVCFLATFLELSFFDDETICFMHKPLFCIKGQVWPCRLGVRVPLCPWLGLVFLARLPSWSGAGGWAGSVVLVLWVAPACFSLGGGLPFCLMMNPQGEHYIHMHAVVGGGGVGLAALGLGRLGWWYLGLVQ